MMRANSAANFVGAGNRTLILTLLLLLPVLVACRPEPDGDRVAVARAEKDRVLADLFRAKGLAYPPDRLFLRAFKDEAQLEVWVWSAGDPRYTHFKTYPVCKQSGGPGPKRREGDLQVPEGFYEVDRFHPRSRFYLSLGLNYPNRSDRILGDPEAPGSDIFIHGDCQSVGCLAMTDDAIKEIYWLAHQVRDRGAGPIEVQLYPYRFDRPAGPPPGDFAAFARLWSALEAGFDWFETNGFPPSYRVDPAGNYVLEPGREP